jgi:hypothetical protein
MRYLEAQSLAKRREDEAKRREKLADRAKARDGGLQAVVKPAEPEPVAETQATPTVTFASERAAEVAQEMGVTDFEFEPSGANGYTVADVRRAAGE